MNYWLMKTEPDECSIDDALAARGRLTPWTGVRNYVARNFMRDTMRIGDGVFFYHSSCAEPGIAGLAEIAGAPYTDPSQFDRKSDYYDPKSSKAAPRWIAIDVRALKKTHLVSIEQLKAHKALAGMLTLQPGNRLSITPVTRREWAYITGKLV